MNRIKLKKKKTIENRVPTSNSNGHRRKVVKLQHAVEIKTIDNVISVIR